MNIPVVVCGENIYVNREYIKGYAFKNTILRVESSILCKNTHVLMNAFGLERDSYALLQGSYIKCFECLLPHKILAC